MQLLREEEFWNTITHFIGLIASIIGCTYLIYSNNNLSILSFISIFFFGFGEKDIHGITTDEEVYIKYEKWRKANNV